MCMMGGGTGGTPIGKQAPGFFDHAASKGSITTNAIGGETRRLVRDKDNPNKWTATALGTPSQSSTTGSRPGGTLQPGVGPADVGGKTLLGA